MPTWFIACIIDNYLRFVIYLSSPIRKGHSPWSVSRPKSPQLNRCWAIFKTQITARLLNPKVPTREWPNSRSVESQILRKRLSTFFEKPKKPTGFWKLWNCDTWMFLLCEWGWLQMEDWPRSSKRGVWPFFGGVYPEPSRRKSIPPPLPNLQLSLSPFQAKSPLLKGNFRAVRTGN